MACGTDLSAFAEKWLVLFSDDAVTSIQLTDPSFGEECLALGFQMDCGKAFCSAYAGDAFQDTCAFKRVVGEITNIPLLGSAVFSKWRYYNHWAYSPGEILLPDNRAWFLAALSRLRALAEAPDVRIKMLRVVSNALCYGSRPGEKDEVEQRLTIAAGGRVYFSSYAFGDGTNMKKIRSTTRSIGSGTARGLLEAAARFFMGETELPMVLDVGGWEATIITEAGETRRFRGSLLSGLAPEMDALSDCLRSALSMPWLLAFDGGQADRIESISVDYRRQINPVNEVDAPRTIRYREHLAIDRERGTLEMERIWEGDFHMRREYRSEFDVAVLLDGIGEEVDLLPAAAEVPDAAPSPDGGAEYDIRVEYGTGRVKAFSGVFDRDGLPAGFAALAERISDCMMDLTYCEMLESEHYEKPRRRQSDRMVCSVRFDEFGSTYSYLSDDPDLKVSDRVVVPVGKSNREAVVTITAVQYFSAENMPFPMDKLKTILRRADGGAGRSDEIPARRQEN